jgi:lysophospholipase L1-like esterase
MLSADPPEARTNSLGLADREYEKAKSAGTRRVALIGDSLARGYRVKPAERFEARIEDRLNLEIRQITGKPFEIWNYSVDGYRMTQLLDVAVSKAAAFEPDAYLLTLTEVTVHPNWGSHLAKLVRDGTDLKYDFLRRVVEQAGIRPDDDPAVAEAKLAPYRLPVLREILAHIKSQVELRGAKLIVILLPVVEDAEDVQAHFEGLVDVVRQVQVPSIDLRDTFAGVKDLESYRVVWSDLHPNAAGHSLIADNLYQKLRQQPEVWSALTGRAGPAN